jgi:hypothetical protein
VDLIVRNARLSDRPSDGPLDIGIESGRKSYQIAGFI